MHMRSPSGSCVTVNEKTHRTRPRLRIGIDADEGIVSISHAQLTLGSLARTNLCAKRQAPAVPKK